LDGYSGFEPLWLPEFLIDFQTALVDWAVRKGRAAIFADCGLGKTPMQLVWAENVRRKTNRPVLILTPLAVSAQTLKEAEKFGIEAERSRDGRPRKGLTVTNYEQLAKFRPEDFAGCVCDESSILKSFDGVTRQEITDFMSKLKYRLLCTATAAPNDYVELGTSSEALGYLGSTDMLGRFFRNDNNTIDSKGRYKGFGAPRAWSAPKWRFKGHAQGAFWRWVCSWARAVRRPSDLGFSDERFILPALREREHIVKAQASLPGTLYDIPAQGLREEREEMRRTLHERCERAAALVADSRKPAVLWCYLNDEGNELARLLPHATQVSGADAPEEKEEKFQAFSSGQARLLVVKPKIGAWGLNWQHCAHMTFFPSHSFEQYYQAVRRCWRFGQEREVVVEVVTTEGGKGAMKNLQRKAQAADVMFSELVGYMGDALQVNRSIDYPRAAEVPSWL
jgi:hypothetical protein